MQIIVDNLLTSYQISGEGRTLVLLHGWGDRAAGLKNIVNELSKRFKIIVPDLPGFGGSQVPATAWGLTDYAKFVADFLQKINAGKVYAFIGHSNGGAVAIRGLGQNILTADKLVLLASSGIRGTHRTRNYALRLVTKSGKVMTAPLPKTTKQNLKKWVYQTVGSDMLVAENLQETFKKVVSDDVQTDAKNTKSPTLIIYGDNDTATPPSYGKLFNQSIKNSQLEIIDGAGHFVHLDKPKETSKLIKDFLK